MIRNLVHLGRFTSRQTTKFGESLGPVGYLAVGPFALLVSLPAWLQPREVAPSILTLNAHLRRQAYLQARLGIPPLPDGSFTPPT